MILNQTNFKKDLRDLFCNAVTKIFGDSTAFLDFLENEKYSTKYDCYLDYNGENYIINRETGEYINWYKLNHIGRSINISAFSMYKTIPTWFEKFLIEFKEGEVKAERYKDCFQPKSDYKSQHNSDEEIAKVFQFGMAFGFIESLNTNKNDIPLDELRAELEDYITHSPYINGCTNCCRLRDDVLRIVDKYKKVMDKNEW